jgi:hypothetical protein
MEDWDDITFALIVALALLVTTLLVVGALNHDPNWSVWL